MPPSGVALVGALTDAQAAAKLSDLLHKNADNEVVGLAAMGALKAIGKTAGPENFVAMGLSPKIIPDIDALTNAFGNKNPAIVRDAAALKQLVGESLGAGAQLDGVLASLDSAMQGCDARLVKSADGKAYYASAGSTSWDPPTEYTAMMDCFDAFAESAEKNAGAMARVADETIERMLDHMRKHIENADALCTIGRALAACV